MARPCSICTHPDLVTIDQALLSDTLSFRDIAGQFAVARASLQRHKTDHLTRVLAAAVHETPGRPVPIEPDRKRDGESGHTTRRLDETVRPAPGSDHLHALQTVVARQEQQERWHALSVTAELGRLFERVTLLFDACDEWLRDPDDPARYTIAPRAGEVTLVYWGQSPDGKAQKKKMALAEALRLVQVGGVAADHAETKMGDPRELLLKTAAQLTGQTQLLVTVLDKLYNAQEVEAFQAAVLEAIGEAAPDVRERITERLRQRRPLRRIAL